MQSWVGVVEAQPHKCLLQDHNFGTFLKGHRKFAFRMFTHFRTFTPFFFFFEKEICAKKSSSFKAQRQMLSKPDNISYCVQPFFCKTCNPQKIWNCIEKYFCQVFSTLLHRVLKIIQRSESIFSPEGKCSATKQSFGNCRGQGLVEHHQWFFDGLLRYILPLIITDHETWRTFITHVAVQ